MAQQVMLAVAGAGKTYHICHAIDPEERNLIMAFTRENIHNIERELCDAYGRIPELTSVMTFDSFVYHNIILPYEPSIGEHFGIAKFKSRGICMTTPPPQRIKNNRGDMIPNPNYTRKDNIRHYITKNHQYYCDTLSELALQVGKGKDSLVKRAAMRLNLFYDTVMIDEFQDFREYDFDLIVKLAKLLYNSILVGDYNQHSVSGTNNTGKPFKIKGVHISYENFVSELKRMGFDVDTTTLEKSRRCSADVCDYISKKLHVRISSNDNHKGSVIWADDNAEAILTNDSIVKLVFSESANYRFPSLNWSYSKGDTVDAACVILTDRFDALEDDDFSVEGIPISTLNKLYVAMTRSRGDLYLIKQSTFKSLKDAYLCGNMKRD